MDGGETLPLEDAADVILAASGSDVKEELVVEATVSEEARTLLEYGPCPASVSGPVTASFSTAGGSKLLDLSVCSCLISLNACCKVPDGAENERPNVMGGPERKLKKQLFHFNIISMKFR